jgi:hypothetical protein
MAVQDRHLQRLTRRYPLRVGGYQRFVYAAVVIPKQNRAKGKSTVAQVRFLLSDAETRDGHETAWPLVLAQLDQRVPSDAEHS